MQKIIIGTTFSQLQCKYLSLDREQALKEILTLPLSTIRVCAYWNEIEQSEKTYNFSILDKIIDEISKKNIEIILALGMKSPRWPEFHIPDWIKTDHNNKETLKKCREYTSKVIERYKDNKNIKYLQIENEPLNKMDITNDRFVNNEFFVGQINLARTLKGSHQKILCTSAINIFPYDFNSAYNNSFNICKNISDAVGVNVYTKIGTPYKIYAEPTPMFWKQLTDWKNRADKANTETWITEAQSEPWENGNMVHTSQSNFPSASPARTRNLVEKLTSIGYTNILLWGCEYWYWQKTQQRSEWWTEINKLLISMAS